MDFITTGAPAVPIKINGKSYNVPRFLLPEQRTWAAVKVQEQTSAALAELPDADARARFRLFFRVPPIDVLTLTQESATPEGIEYVLRAQLAAASVSPGEIEGMIKNVDPVALRFLARQVCSADEAAMQVAADSNDPGATGNPTTGPVPLSEDSHGTTATTSPASPQPTESTPTA